MAELLSVQLHIPPVNVGCIKRSESRKSNTPDGDTPTKDAGKFDKLFNSDKFSGLPKHTKRKTVDIVFNELSYKVREGRHKGIINPINYLPTRALGQIHRKNPELWHML